MCLLVVASHLVEGTSLLIGANRDELLDRPTTVMTALHAAAPRVLGGRDEHSGGTWLAVNEFGVFAALTNQPLGEAKDLSKRSRGELPLAMAMQPSAALAAQTLLADYRPAEFNGAWLLVGDRDDLFFIDFTGLVTPEAMPLPPGLHVLENRALGAPSAKEARVRELLEPHHQDVASATAALEVALGDHVVLDPAPGHDGDAPRLVPNCVHLDTYGTRSSCIIRVPSESGVRPSVRVASGPPCRTPFVDVGDWWSADQSVAQNEAAEAGELH